MICSIFGEIYELFWFCFIAYCKIGFWRIASDYGWLKLTFLPVFLCYLSGFIDAMIFDKGREDKFDKLGLIFDIYGIAYIGKLFALENCVFEFPLLTLSPSEEKFASFYSFNFVIGTDPSKIFLRL